VVLVCATVSRLAGLRIAPISQLTVAMNGVVAAALQLIAHGRLAGAGKAFDEIVPPAHVLETTHRGRRMRAGVGEIQP